MRLSWKIFFITTPLFILFLTLFGTWIVQESFESNLSREVESCQIENELFQTSYELTWHSLTVAQRSRTSVQMIVEPFHRKMESWEGCTRVYDEDREILYQDNELTVPHQIWERLEAEEEEQGRNMGSQTIRQDGQYYVAVLGKSDTGIWIETLRNVTSIFDDREGIYRGYRFGVLLVSLVAGLCTLFALLLVMRNTQKLSSATRRFAMGRYDTRVAIRSDDEIGRLADDFNWMADVMNRQMEQLQGEVRRQEEFTSAFAHELKTPLTSIIGYAQTLRSMELTPEESDMCADYIYRQGKRLQSLSYKLLEMAMADQYQMSYRNVPVGELFEEVMQTVQASLQEKQLQLLADWEDGAVLGDRVLLGSLLINLIDNARKASFDGGRIWLTGRKMAGGYSITVEDEGKGIPEEELSRITEAFYMVDKSRARKEGGAGLGLALCKKILELHQGSWQMTSEPGKGLRVIVLLGGPASRAKTPRRPRRKEDRDAS